MAARNASAIHEHAASTVARRIYIRWLIIAVVFLLVLALIMTVLTGPQAAPSYSTSLSYHPSGYRALYTLTERLGFSAGRHVTSYGDLPDPSSNVLFVLSPSLTHTFARGESEAVLAQVKKHLDRWIRDGGSMVYAGNTNTVYSFFGIELDLPEGTALPGKADLYDIALNEFSGSDYYFPSKAPHPEPVRVPFSDGTIAGAGPFTHTSKWRASPDPLFAKLFHKYFTRKKLLPFFPAECPGPYEVLARFNGMPVALSAPHGKGTICVVSTAFPFSNLALQFAETGPFSGRLLAHITGNGRKTVLFDEYTHGIIRRRGPLSWITRTALLYPALTLFLITAMLIWQNMVRLGPPEEKRSLPRRAKEEYVVTLAELYHRTHRYNTAAELILRGHLAQLSRQRGTDMRETERFYLQRHPGLKELFGRIHGKKITSAEALRKTVSRLEKEIRKLPEHRPLKKPSKHNPKRRATKGETTK